MKAAFQAHLGEEFEAGKDYKPNKADWLDGKWSHLNRDKEEYQRGETAIKPETFAEIGRALAAKLAGLHEQSVEHSALRPKAAERDALARERDEALAALAAEREEAARLAAELAAAVARGAAAHAKERAATRATEDAHIALAEAKAKVASLTERSAREIEGAGSFCFLSCLSSSSFFFLTLSASFFLLSFFFLLVKSARRG